MDKGYAVAVKKLGTIGVTVQIMRKGITLPHEISVFSEEELRIRSEAEHQTLKLLRRRVNELRFKQRDCCNERRRREARLLELQEELLQLRAEKSLGGTPASIGAYKATKKKHC